MVFGDVGQPSDDHGMKAYRNAALFIVSLVALGIVTAGDGFSAEYILFLVTAALGVLVVSLLVLKALREENR